MPPSSLSDANTPRIQRGSPPPYELTDSNVGSAKPYLLRDSDGRCAYSTIHERETSTETIEVEHFDPRRIGGKKNHSYENLLPAFGPCNRSKGYKWPSASAASAGARFLNPTLEKDYGVHLFEDPKSHKIVAVTPAGQYHLRYLALNSEYLISKRRRRSDAKALLDQFDLTRQLSGEDAERLRAMLWDSALAVSDIDPP